MSTTCPDTITVTDERTETERPWLWNVVLIDDDDHSYDYVINLSCKLFAHPVERAVEIAKAVDAQGRVILMTTHKEHAELKRDQIHAFGRDRLISACQGAMSAVLEPAEFDGESENPGEPPALFPPRIATDQSSRSPSRSILSVWIGSNSGATAAPSIPSRPLKP